MWVAATESGAVWRINTTTGTSEPLAGPASVLDPAGGLELQVSPDGGFVALGERAGRRGVVLDASSGERVMTLDRGDYLPSARRWSLAFFVRSGRVLLVHATDWNRLDITDPSTGRSCTSRSGAHHQRGGQIPEHYLDYFHCRVHVCPSGEAIAEDGWVWHPLGVPRLWSLTRWIQENPWESEDGPSVRELPYRDGAWDLPMCWIGSDTLAVYGFGSALEWLLPAALLYDGRSGELLRWFPGPRGEFSFDRFLLSACQETGTAVWDVLTGERLLADPQLRPVAYHPSAHCFLSTQERGEFVVSSLVGDPGRSEPAALESR